MNLQHITTDLDLTLRRRLRRTNMLQHWNQHHGLAHDLDTLYQQMRDRDRTVSHPVLAILVDLAKAGDIDAAQVVTVALLQRFADKENTKGGTWDGFAGHLYEAIVTCHCTRSKCLREIIERNALRRHLKIRIAGSHDLPLPEDAAMLSPLPGPDDIVIRMDQRTHVTRLIADLVEARALSTSTQRILSHIAGGTERDDVFEFSGCASNTARTRCRRAARTLSCDRLRQELAWTTA